MYASPRHLYDLYLQGFAPNVMSLKAVGAKAVGAKAVGAKAVGAIAI